MIRKGFIKPVISPDDYIFGASSVEADILQPDGNWKNILPQKEIQIRNYETYNCTAFNSLDQLEIYLSRKFNLPKNYSERGLGIVAGTKPPGNSPNVVYQAVRNYGVFNEEFLPFDNSVQSVEQYYSPSPLPRSYEIEAKKFKDEFDFHYEWVFTENDSLETKKIRLKEALKYSPVALSVYAWQINDKGYYIKPSAVQDTHWTVCVGFREGEYWEIFDSYEPTLKKLAWDFGFGFASKIFVEKQTAVLKKNLDLLQVVLNWLALIIPSLKKKEVPIEAKSIPFVEKVEAKPEMSKIELWAVAIEDFENFNESFNNPGALRESKFQKGKKNGFAFFETYAIGKKALLYQLVIACNGKSKNYQPEMTLVQFFEKYAPKVDGNNPQLYASYCAQRMSVSPKILLKDIYDEESKKATASLFA